MNPRPTSDYLMNEIYSSSGHGLTEPASLSSVLASENEYPNSTKDADTLVRVALKHLAPGPKGRSALDIGSGYGFFSRRALQAGFQVTAVNPGEWENRLYRELTGRRPIVEPIERVELNSKFDLVLMSQILEHIHDPATVLKKVARLMNPKGILAIAVPNVRWVLVTLLREKERGVFWVPEHLNYFTATGLHSLLRRTGFNILETRNVAKVPYNAVSRRLRLSGATRSAANSLVKWIQWAPMKALEWAGRGIHLQVWASPKTSR